MLHHGYDEGQSENKKIFSIYDGTVSLYYTVGIFNTETYEVLLCSGLVIG